MLPPAVTKLRTNRFTPKYYSLAWRAEGQLNTAKLAARRR